VATTTRCLLKMWGRARPCCQHVARTCLDLQLSGTCIRSGQRLRWEAIGEGAAAPTAKRTEARQSLNQTTQQARRGAMKAVARTGTTAERDSLHVMAAATLNQAPFSLTVKGRKVSHFPNCAGFGTPPTPSRSATGALNQRSSPVVLCGHEQVLQLLGGSLVGAGGEVMRPPRVCLQ